MSKNIIPEEFKTIFWDADIQTLEIEKHKKYIIERVLFLGDIEETKWLINTYGKEVIKNIARDSKVIRSEVKNFYLNVY